MPEYCAVRCCSCLKFQARQVTKVNKFTCVLCNQKQTIQKLYAISSSAKDIRLTVQRLNTSQGEAQEQMASFALQNQELGDPEICALDARCVPARARSREHNEWETFLDDEPHMAGPLCSPPEQGFVTALPERGKRRCRTEPGGNVAARDADSMHGGSCNPRQDQSGKMGHNAMQRQQQTKQQHGTWSSGHAEAMHRVHGTSTDISQQARAAVPCSQQIAADHPSLAGSMGRGVLRAWHGQNQPNEPAHSGTSTTNQTCPGTHQQMQHSGQHHHQKGHHSLHQHQQPYGGHRHMNQQQSKHQTRQPAAQQPQNASKWGGFVSEDQDAWGGASADDGRDDGFVTEL